MDTTEATMITERIQTLEPENASKIIDYFMSQEIEHCILVRMAFGPNALIEEFCREAKYELGLLPKGSSLNPDAIPFYFHDRPLPPSSTRNEFLDFSRNPNNAALHPSLIRDNPNFNSSPFHDGSSQQRQQLSFLATQQRMIAAQSVGDFGSQMSNRQGSGQFGVEGGLRSPSEQQSMISGPFMRDFGSPMSNRQGSGRFGVEGGLRSPSEQQSMIAAKSVADFGSPMSNRQGSGQFGGEGGLRSPSEQQRMIAGQFIRGFGSPVSNRQGSGQFGQGYCYSPGSHEREDLVSRRIFLAFQPTSSFTNEDVSTYFSEFGEVDCVDLPKDQQGTFGFVTFTNAETVRTILNNEENSHVIGGSVLWVKGCEKGNRLSPSLTSSTLSVIGNPLSPSLTSNTLGVEGGYCHSPRRQERKDSVSRKIYLTFPPGSSFTVEEASIYFSKFGAVEDVDIPYQQKRMFGFVTFANDQTVERILARQNPHLISRSWVTVKPYKGKEKREKQQQQVHQLLEGGNCSPSSSPSGLDDSRELYNCRIGPRKTQEMLRRKTEQADIQLPDIENFSINDHQHSPSTGSPAHLLSQVMEGDSDRGEQVETNNEETSLV